MNIPNLRKYTQYSELISILFIGWDTKYLCIFLLLQVFLWDTKFLYFHNCRYWMGYKITTLLHSQEYRYIFWKINQG